MTFLAIIAGTYLVVCILAYLFQSQMIHFPDRKILTTPAAGRLEYRDVFFDTEDGPRLHGWWVPAANPKAVVLFCHGNAGNISDRVSSIRIFHDIGLSVFIFDYRSYGRSEGRITEAGLYADARAARKWLIEELEIHPDRIIYFGRSLGSAVAFELASRYLPLALIAESPFTSICELGASVYPWLPVKLLCRIRYDSTTRVSELNCPKLFIHSKEDEIVPYRLGRRLFSIAAEPKMFLEITGSHNDGFLTSGSVYVDGLRQFLAAHGI